MPDPLYEAIQKALNEPINAALFERCAVDLLREYYSNLRPVPPNKDAGQDGLGEMPDGTRFFLAATTAKDYRRNLLQSAQSHVGAGGDRRAVVLATTREVSGQRRESLRRDLQDQTGLRLIDVHDQGDFAQLLYDHPKWRKDLLNVRGVAGALSRFPATSRPTPTIPLTGRDDELEALRATEGDLLILGKAGIGKTFLLHELLKEGWGLFDAGRSLPELEDAILEMKPARVIIDDAHFVAHRITELCRLRKEMDGDFAIIATSWPGQKDRVAGAFPDEPPTFSLEELDRDQILKIIQAVGIAGPEELQWQLIFQAHGRPGLAVTLSRACVSGNVVDVLTGETLLKDVLGWYERALSEKTRDVLGFLALAGASGATVEQAGSFLGTDLPEVNGLVRGLASGGAIDEATPLHPERLVVQPEALRYPLVRDMFFGGPGSPDVKGAVATLPNASAASFPLIAAALAGAGVDLEWLAEIGEWSDERFASHFAVLGPSELRIALKRAPAHLTAIAKEAYRRGVAREHALWTLMEFANPDPRAELWGSETPLNSIKLLLHRHEGSIEDRRLAIRLADRWLQEGRDANVVLTVLSHVMQPEKSGTSYKPGSADVMTLSAAVLPKPEAEDRAGMWDSVLDLIEREHPSSFGTVFAMVQPWVFPGTLAMGRGPSPDVAGTMHAAAKRVVRCLITTYANNWVAMHRLRPLANECGLEVSVPEPFATMFPVEPWTGSGDYKAWEQDVIRAARNLAEDLSEQPIGVVAKLIATADSDARQAGITYPRLTPKLVEHLASASGDPHALLLALEECGAAADLLTEVLNCLADRQLPDLESAIVRLLGQRSTVPAAVAVALTRPVSRQVKEQALAQLNPRSFDFDGAIIRNELDHPTLELLLAAPDEEVAWRVAIALWGWRHREAIDGLPEELLQRSRDLVVKHPADDQLYHSLFEQHPDVLVDSIRAWWERLRTGSLEFWPIEVEDLIAGLSIETRLDLIADIPADLLSDHRLVTQLVSHDLEVAKALFDREDLEHLHGAALSGDPDAAWMESALLALDKGWSPERVAFETSMDVAFSGEASANWQNRVDAFESLRVSGPNQEPDRERIVAAGIALYEQKRDEDLQRERRERVFGRES